MATPDKWREICAKVREANDPVRSPYFAELYQLMVEDGRRILGSLVLDEQLDVIHLLIADGSAPRAEEKKSALLQIVEADSPKAMFRTVLKRRGVTWHRHVTSRLDQRSEAQVRARESTETDQGSLGDAAYNSVEDDRVESLDMAEFLPTLSQRDRDVVIAVCAEDSREEVARAFNTSRANVDQILSRVRRAYAAWQREGANPNEAS